MTVRSASRVAGSAIEPVESMEEPSVCFCAWVSPAARNRDELPVVCRSLIADDGCVILGY